MNGITLLANITNVDEKILMNDEVIRLFLIRVVELSNLTPVYHTLNIEHFPIKLNNKYRGGYGISGGMILVESHVYIHTWPEDCYFRFEMSSCKEFDIENVLKIIKIFFGKDIDIKYNIVKW